MVLVLEYLLLDLPEALLKTLKGRIAGLFGAELLYGAPYLLKSRYTPWERPVGELVVQLFDIVELGLKDGDSIIRLGRGKNCVIVEDHGLPLA